ncbi:MAG: hypothetical protein AABY87_06600 [bacterium]
MNMKKNLLIILLCAFPYSLYPIDNMEADINIYGSDWQKWSESSKIFFVEGWVKCGDAASGNLILYMDKLKESIELSNSQNKEFENAGVLLRDVTIGQIVDTINEIYSDYRVTTTEITEIMPLVAGRLIQGWTVAGLDGLIAINVKLKRCEKAKGGLNEECNTLRRKRNSYLQEIGRK